MPDQVVRAQPDCVNRYAESARDAMTALALMVALADGSETSIFRCDTVWMSTNPIIGRKNAVPPHLDLRMPILVVDDYQTMIRIIRNLLKQLGFSEIDDAGDGTAALARLKERRYGLVISDWNMQPMTGYELLQHVRADEVLQATPFLMITAESKIENVVAAKKAGVNNYIVKPFTITTLKMKIEGVCGD